MRQYVNCQHCINTACERYGGPYGYTFCDKYMSDRRRTNDARRGENLMDIEKLIELLRNAAGGPEGIKMCQDAATALSTLQAENERLRAELEQVKREREEFEAALRRKREGTA